MPDRPEAVPDATPRQRWRLVVGRGAEASDQTQRELTEAWEAALLSSGLPIARADAGAGRPRIAFGAALPVGTAADGELIDVVLTDRWPAWHVREAVAAAVPDGWRLVELMDVWLAGPALPGQVAAADHRITLDATPDAVTTTGLRSACTALLAAEHLPRSRPKGGGTVRYDLRPLVIDVAVVDDGPPIVLRTRTRFHPELGTGRPEEVVAALAESLGTSLPIAGIVRERLLLVGELGDGP